MTRLATAFGLCLCLCAGAAQADGLEFSGTVSMGLAGTNTNGETRVEPIARTEGTISYSFETDSGFRFTLAYEFDETLVVSGADEGFLPGHR